MNTLRKAAQNVVDNLDEHGQWHDLKQAIAELDDVLKTLPAGDGTNEQAGSRSPSASGGEPINDGGPAFPAPEMEDPDQIPHDPRMLGASQGMSLRAWLAGQALAGLMQNGQFASSQIGESAVSFADATLAALKGKEESK